MAKENWIGKKCLCGSGEQFENCCHLFITGDKLPSTAETLMRSRYSAFVVQEPEYIYESHDPATRSQVSLKEITSWSTDSQWEGLQIVSTEKGLNGDTQGIVEFIATYTVDDNKSHHHEKSQFTFKDNKWYFTDGQIIQNSYRRTTPKVGRNEPCPCGSGKKFKKCCG